jgi:hypothetical protein
MKHISMRTLIVLSLGTGGSSLSVIAACSSNSSAPVDQASSGSSSSGSGGSGSSTSGSSMDTDATTGDMDSGIVTYDGPPGNVDGGVLSCDTPDGLTIKFNPIYSGFDGTHTYQVPVFVEGVDPSAVTWGSSDPTMVHFDPYVRGIMITTRKAGDVTVVATGDGKCGSAPLHIAQYTADEWNSGNARYNNNTPLIVNPEAGIPTDASFNLPDGYTFDASGIDAAVICQYLQEAGAPNVFMNETPACTNCHGVGSSGQLFGMSLFNDVAHTPEQTGGFSEDELTNVFYNAIIPDGGTFDNNIIPYCAWQAYHKWQDIDTPGKQAGMRAYLRSLTPQEQTGCFELFKVNACAAASDGGQ